MGSRPDKVAGLLTTMEKDIKIMHKGEGKTPAKYASKQCSIKYNSR
jgi:hypothetical protein